MGRAAPANACEFIHQVTFHVGTSAGIQKCKPHIKHQHKAAVLVVKQPARAVDKLGEKKTS